jgi:hypothetical protein
MRREFTLSRVCRRDVRRTGGETLALRATVCHQVAGLAAGQAIVLAVVAEADVVPALAQNAKTFAPAAFLFLIALRADVGHEARVARFLTRLK